MRAHGWIDSGSHLGTDGHACWIFDQQQEFVAAAIEYLTDGLRAEQRIAYVGSEPVEEQREMLAPLGDVGTMIDKGALQLFELTDLYKVGEPVGADAQVATYLAAADAAVADGYTGLRVAAQVTDLVVEPRTREAHVRWESIADRYCTTHPLSAFCGYQRGALPDQLLGDLAAVHPASNEGHPAVPFHLFSDSGKVVLAGEIDCFSAADFDRLLELTCEGDDRVHLDLAELDFIDHHGLTRLATHTQRLATHGACAVQNPPPIVDRLCELLDLKL
ncbi:MAG: MEDS domain-containing protein [Solirubrobacterales bacterium]